MIAAIFNILEKSILERFDIGMLDFIAFCWFIFCWLGYVLFSDIKKRNDENNLLKIMHGFRIQWMDKMIRREDRISDGRVVSDLTRSVTFFASTSIFIVAGLLSILGYGNKIAANSSFTFIHTSPALWYIKTSLLIVIFIYVFFKNTWTLRQLNYASVLIVAAPVFKEKGKLKGECALHAKRIAQIVSNAARHFTLGTRGYYFGLAALSWYVHPALFMVISAFVIFVIYRREFMSRTVDFLTGES